MSVVAVKVNKNGFEMCADSMAAYGQLELERSKLYECNGVIIGTAGYTEDMSLMQLFIRTSKPEGANETAILNFMSDFYDWIHKKTGKWSDEYNDWLIGIEGKVFSVSGWDVVAIKDIHAIGSGGEIALTAMHLGHSAYEAVKIAIKLNIYCGEPIIKFAQKKEK